MNLEEEPKKILVVMLRRIGDVILTIPPVKALRKRFPNAKIDFLVEAPCHEVLAWNTDISRIHVYSKGPLNYVKWILRVRRERYDWVIDFMGNPRTAMLTFSSGAALRAGPAHVSHRWAYSLPLIQPSEICYSALEKIRMLKGTGFAVGTVGRIEVTPASAFQKIYINVPDNISPNFPK